MRFIPSNVALVLILLSKTISAQSLLQPTLVRASAFPVGSTVSTHNTLEYKNQASLVRAVCDRISEKSREKFHSAEDYIKAIGHSREGQAYEAVFAFQENRRLESSGSQYRWLVTKLEGRPHDPADLALVDPAGCVVGHAQVKRSINSLQELKNYLNIYPDMQIVTTQESYDRLVKQLQRKKASLERRGVIDPELDKIEGLIKRQVVVDGFGKNNRLSSKLELKDITKDTITKSWNKRDLHAGVSHSASTNHPSLARSEQELSGRSIMKSTDWAKADRGLSRGMPGATPPEPGLQAINRKLSPLMKSVIKYGGKLLIVADIGGIAYEGVEDFRRFRMRDIDAQHFIITSVVKSGEVILTSYAVYSPEPHTKILSAGGAFLLFVADVGLDYLEPWQLNRQRAVLDSMTISQEYLFIRRMLIRDSNDTGGNY